MTADPTGGWQRRAVVLAIVSLVGVYYLWQARAATGRYEFGHDLDGYYDFLGRALAGGHLYLPVPVPPELLALPDPWDPAAGNGIKMHDMVLYRGRYYLYFGAAPAVLLFTPWRLATGHDLPENFGAFLLCFGGFLFACGALLRVLRLAEARPPTWLLAFLLLGLGVCQSVPYLLNRVAVYEIAIAGGCFCLSAALYFLARALPERRAAWLAASGVAFGLAVACRPHLVLAGAVAAAVLLLPGKRRGAGAFLAAWVLVGVAIGAYNYERFGNPLEFGFRYQLAGPGQNRVGLSPRNLEPGAYYMLLSRPEFSGIFPWMRTVFRFPFDSPERHPLPDRYFVEPSVGALWIAPFILAALLLPWDRKLVVPWICAAASLAILLFLIGTHLATHRYEVDFLPLAVFAALANLGIRGARSLAWRAAVPGVIVYSMLANMALGIAGPYDDILRYRPANYVRLARRFSAQPEYRPLLDPRVEVDLTAAFVPEGAGFREPLVTVGRSHYNCFLYAERGGPTLRLVLRSEQGQATYDLPEPGTTPVAISLRYQPETGRIAAAVNGEKVMELPAPTLVTAPAQVEIGANHSDVGLTYPRFTGRFLSVRKIVSER